MEIMDFVNALNSQQPIYVVNKHSENCTRWIILDEIDIFRGAVILVDEIDERYNIVDDWDAYSLDEYNNMIRP